MVGARLSFPHPLADLWEVLAASTELIEAVATVQVDSLELIVAEALDSVGS
jgi:hypothetical protein